MNVERIMRRVLVAAAVVASSFGVASSPSAAQRASTALPAAVAGASLGGCATITCVFSKYVTYQTVRSDLEHDFAGEHEAQGVKPAVLGRCTYKAKNGFIPVGETLTCMIFTGVGTFRLSVKIVDAVVVPPGFMGPQLVTYSYSLVPIGG